MQKSMAGCFIALVLWCQLARAQNCNINGLIDAIRNLTTAIYETGGDMQQATKIADEAVAVIINNLPEFETYFAAIAKLPASIDHAVEVVNALVPILRNTCYFLGACILAGGAVSIGCQISQCCKRKPPIRLNEQQFDF